MGSAWASARARARSRAASCPGVGQRRSTAFPTASIPESNAASPLSVFTRSPDGLSILLAAPTQVGSPSPSSERLRSKPAGPLSCTARAGCGDGDRAGAYVEADAGAIDHGWDLL